MFFSNQKAWLDHSVRLALIARDKAFSSGNLEEKKIAQYNLRKAIKRAKRQYMEKIEKQLSENDSRRVWQGIHSISDLKARPSFTTNVLPTLTDELNLFYARFETTNMTPQSSPASSANTPNSTPRTFYITEGDVRRVFE